MSHIILILAAYLVGSVSSGIICCKLMGLEDPRSSGSGNPGATNVLRTGSRKAAAITLLGDMLKGVAPVLLANYLGATPLVTAGVGLAAFLGHLYPAWYRFKGGKGVATALGVIFALSWLAGLATAATWLATFAVFRISSVAALAASALAPLYMFWFAGSAWLTATIALIAILIFWRHRSNIRGLIAGTEGRISKHA